MDVAKQYEAVVLGQNRAALPYRAGALVSANMPYPLTTVSDNSDMYVYFSMTENQLLAPVSYTHLDVYKRQVRNWPKMATR